MKKFQITIAEPCHENWDRMTPGDRGRFCGSCQKTVTDFSSMSDKQIAEFFKKPKQSVCGRFHSDQLERPIEVPRKRIPWVKYFFSVTWPAVILFLKSCGPKLDVMGKPFTEVSSPKKQGQELYTTMGLLLPEILPEDSVPKVTLPSPLIEPPIVGNIDLQPREQLMGDTIILPIDTTLDVPPKECKQPMDTVNIIGYDTKRMGQLIAGGISISKVANVKDIKLEKQKEIKSPQITAYPNPARSGQELTITTLGKMVPTLVQLFSANGQVILSRTGNWKESNVKFSIPATALPGPYILRVTTEDQQSNSVKILVTN